MKIEIEIDDSVDKAVLADLLNSAIRGASKYTWQRTEQLDKDIRICATLAEGFEDQKDKDALWLLHQKYTDEERVVHKAYRVTTDIVQSIQDQLGFPKGDCYQ